MGARKNTAFPESTTRIAARIATSVFPNPTSPYTNRSMGTGFVEILYLMSSIADN